MQFRCYRCGYVLGGGMPPLEALSIEQAAVVGEINLAQYAELEGTVYDGLSPANLCDFCLRAVADFREHYELQREGETFAEAQVRRDAYQSHRAEFKNRSLTCKTCQWTYTVQDGPLRCVLYNRWQQVHMLVMAGCNVVELVQLVTSGMEISNV